MKLKLKLFFALLTVVTFSATAQNFAWAKTMVGTGTTDEGSQSVAIDAAGNVYTTGQFFGTVDFDPGASTFNLTSTGLEDIFISKLDASGNFLWAKKIGGTGTDVGWRIALDASSNVVVSGYFRYTADFDPGSAVYTLSQVGAAANADIFVLKLDTNGNFVWVKQFGAPSVDDDAYGLYIDNLSNVYITGYFLGTIDFDPGAGIANLTPAGSSDIYILKLDASGSFVWAKKMGGTVMDEARSIYVDGSGNVFTVGSFKGTTDFDPSTSTLNLISAGNEDIFITKLDASGNFIWAKSIGSTGIDVALSIAVDASGNSYTCGYFNGTVDFDPGVGISNLTSAGTEDIFVCKLDANGNFSWAKRIGSTSTDKAVASIVDASGNIQITGSYSGTVDFDPGATTTNFSSAGLTDIFVCTLDASGNFLRAKTIGGTGNDEGNSIAVTSSGSSYISGEYSGTVDFDPSASTFNLTSGGGKDIFVMKFLAPCNITNTGSQTNLTCNGICTGSATMIPSGGTSPYTYSWAPSGGSAATANSLCAGSYTCTVTDNVGCTSTRTYILTQPPAITVGASLQSNVICNGGNNGAASVNASGGTGTLTYNWTPGNPTGDGTASVSGLTAGTWTCTVTDGNACTATRTFSITQPPAIAVSIASQTNTTCNGGTNGAASVTASGGVGILAYDWMPGNPTGDGTNSISGIFANTWTCNVSDENGCTASQAITITQPPAISVLTSSISPPSCNGGNNGSASVSASGGTGSLSYNWTPGNPTGDGTTSVSGLTAGSWTCTATDGSGCTGARTINLTQPTAISVAAVSQTNVSCNGSSNGSASASASGGTGTLSFNWTPYGGTASTATGLTAGTYTCTVTDANLCSASRTFIITQPTAIVVNAVSQTNVSCNAGNNGAATISASGGTGAYTYNWTPFGGTGITASALIAGTYTCTVTDANACSAIRTFTITQPTAIVVNAVSQTNVSCNAGNNGAATIAASGGTGSFTYNWTPGNPTGDGTASVTGLTAGSWTCTVTDANACSASRIITITQPTPIAVVAFSQTNVSCNAGNNGAATISASGGTGALTYNWTPGNPTGDGTASVSGLSAGSWTCTVTDANACSALSIINITEPAAISVAAVSQTNVSCNGGSNGSATASAAGGTGTLSFNWTPYGGTASTASGLTAGTYTCTVTDANACLASRTFTITEPTAISVLSASQTNVSCNAGNNGAATIAASGGTGAYTYNWTPFGGTGISAAGLIAGTYTCSVTDANLCSSSLTFSITEPTAISVTIVSQTNVSCNAGNNGAATISAVGGTGAFTYNWTPGNPTGDGTASVSELSAGSFTCTVTDENGCSAFRIITITEPTPISVGVSSQTNVSCNGGSNGSASVFASGGTGSISFNWLPFGGTSAFATGLSAGTYSCNISDANGCSAIQLFTILEPTAILVAPVSQTNISCNGGNNGAAAVSASGGTGVLLFNWSPSGGSAPAITGLTANTYTCSVSDENGCSATQTFIITEPSQIIVSSSSQNNVSCNGGSNGDASASAIGGTGLLSYSWTPFGGSTSSATGLSAGIYTVTATDENGCSSSLQFNISEPTAIIVNTVSQTNNLCNGGNNGNASISVIGGIAGYTYDWTPGNPTGDASNSISNLTAGNWNCSITDANGCVTNHTVSITEPAAIIINQSNIICAGASINVGVNTYSISGVYTDVLTAVNGCDSTVITNLTVNTAISTSQIIVRCAGESITVGVNTYSTSGVYTDILTATNGCDSTVTTNLTVNPAISGSQTIVRCAGESITVGLNTYSISGVYTDVLTAANGCDSTVTTNLTVKPSINIATTLSGTTITAIANPASYQWIDCNNSNLIIAGATNQSFVSTMNGSYAVIVSQNGCSDTSACVSITNTGINGSIQNNELLIYPNPANEKVIIELGNLSGEYLKIMNAIGQVVYDAEIKNTKIEIDLSDFANGIYTIQVQTAKGIVLKKLVKN